ncbi:ammonium transporter [Hydrogenophaga sp.]|uniref:ammonium transporter n=1 Tax=Hydrogenophaga sp. TaxID=1904254 RepID=UPI00271C353E|nr:ammonium transporter [Hydrogenophaga sp.]MDO9435444.1 ammonium transporter [Hydrogenophaga sp.]
MHHHRTAAPLAAIGSASWVALLWPLSAAAQAAPETIAPAPAALTAPGLAAASTLQGADTAWLMVSTALVLLMTLPGIALFYGGMVRRSNVINTMASVVGIAAVVSLLWFGLAYSLAFTPGGALGGFIGGMGRIGFSGMELLQSGAQVAVSHLAPHVPESVFAMFQLTFAIITCALVVGALVERMHFGALLLFAGLWLLLVYAPIAHWVWEPSGWLARLGALDFAGGAVVHINAGAAALVCAFALGPRTGYGREPFVPFNLGITMAGTGLLWVGWFGFNGGSALAADGRAGLAILVTHVAAAAGAVAWMATEWLSRKRTSLLGMCSGIVAGLVAITPAAGFVTPRGALIIGLAAGAACYWGATVLKHKLGADDSLDVFGVHGVGGLVGALLTGVLVDPGISGAQGSLVTQAIACVAVLAYSLVMTAVVLWITSRVVRLRVREGEERAGLDVSLHNESLN